MTAAGSSKALAAWTELNDRQQGTLATIYELDQEAEASQRRAGARGDYDRSPAAVWRALEFAHDPAGFGMTELQMRLSLRGWHSQGNGSTMAALARRGLIRQDWRPTALGRMLTVSLTREGRAAARAGTSKMPGGARKVALGRRSWEVLALLWAADVRGSSLAWGYSTTIERALIDKHVPPLACRAAEGARGYEITDRGREFYREHYAAHTAAYPEVEAQHPDGAGAAPWPPRADELLAEHRRYYRALCDAWQDAERARAAAEEEVAAGPVRVAEVLPAVVVEQAAARSRLWEETARARAELAGEHAGDLRDRTARAARVYAVAALAAWDAAVSRADPLGQLQGPGEGDGWDEQRLAPPRETGVHAIDAEAGKLHAAAVGAPLRRRGPAPKHRRIHRAPRVAARPEPPGGDLAALAEFLRGHLKGGALVRRLHGAAGP